MFKKKKVIFLLYQGKYDDLKRNYIYYSPEKAV
jgi:hypothetical protein